MFQRVILERLRNHCVGNTFCLKCNTCTFEYIFFNHDSKYSICYRYRYLYQPHGVSYRWGLGEI